MNARMSNGSRPSASSPANVLEGATLSLTEKSANDLNLASAACRSGVIRIGCLDPEEGSRLLAIASKELRPFAERGHAEAQYCLGKIYSVGIVAPPEGCAPLPKDMVQALSWYLKAAEQGHPEAQSEMAHARRSGNGIPRDEKRALMWYILAAAGNQQEFCGMRNLWAYDSGMPPADVLEAQSMAWRWAKAHPQANTNTKALLRDGSPEEVLKEIRYREAERDEWDRRDREQETEEEELTEEDVANWPGATGGNWT